MNSIDVFNGDADGICALQQLRLQTPQPDARLITGVKRNIALLDQLAGVADCRLTVLDISLDRNREALKRLLQCNNQVFYADHHYSGEIPVSPLLEVHIDPASTVCTSLIIDRLLNGAFRLWAIAGAFGDNLDEAAHELASTLGLNDGQRQALKEIGTLLNYNGYGLALDDLLVHPADLFRNVNQFTDPFVFHQTSPLLQRLRQGHEEDMTQAAHLKPASSQAGGRVFLLPEAAWARRVVGILANRLSREQPAVAHAVLLPRPDRTFLVSVRAPLTTRQGADALCRQFSTGGGRAAAAGINQLPEHELGRFIEVFTHHFVTS